MPGFYTSTVIRIHFRKASGRTVFRTFICGTEPPAKPLTQMEMDDVYALPFTRCAHPDYEKLGGVPRPQRSSSSDQQQGLFWRMQLLRTDLSTRGGSYRHQVTNLCCRRQRRSRMILILRDISMMWADRLQISGIHPVKSR